MACLPCSGWQLRGREMTTTSVFILVAVIALAVYDLVAFVKGGEGSTISRVTRRIGSRFPAVTFAAGFVCGHIWGYMPEPPVTDSPEPSVVEELSHVDAE